MGDSVWFPKNSVCLLIGKSIQFLQHPVQVFLIYFFRLILDDNHGHIRHSRRLPEGPQRNFDLKNFDRSGNDLACQ